MTLFAHCRCGRNAFEIDGELHDQLTRSTCSSVQNAGNSMPITNLTN
jgi:hypothetical protein